MEGSFHFFLGGNNSLCPGSSTILISVTGKKEEEEEEVMVDKGGERVEVRGGQPQEFFSIVTMTKQAS